MKNKFSIALTIALTLALVAATFVLADNLLSDGDGLTPIAEQNLALGDICSDSTTIKPILHAISHNGTGNNVFANNAVVAVSINSMSGTGLSASGGGNITLPDNWTSTPNNTLSSSVSSSITIVAGGTGSFIGTVNYDAIGARSTGGSLTKSDSLTVTANVVNCDTNPPTLNLPADFDVEATSTSGAVVTYAVSADDANPSHPAVSCAPASGTTFGFGTTIVNCSATDAANNTGSGNFKVTVEDTTAPTVTAPADVTLEAVDGSGAVVTYSDATASDSVDGSLAASCLPASGSTFPLGSTLVTCSATDSHSNTGSSTFHVNIQDTTAPLISVPGNITAEATSAAGAAVIFSTSASDIVDGSVAVDCDANSGDTFPLGTTLVSCSATDSNNNTSPASFNITVEDTTEPEIEAHNAVSAEATSASGAVVSYDSPATHDLVDGDGVATCLPASGSVFALGTTPVECSITDAHGNTANSSFDVNVVDTTAPTLTLPADQLLEATGPAGAVAIFTASATDTVDSSLTVSCDANSGETFPLGITTVTCSVSDDAGNPASGSFTIEVKDNTAPVIASHGPVTAEATSAAGALVSYTASATSDIVDGAGVATCAPGSGSLFALGNTTVYCNATDDAGNHATQTSFVVSVVDTTAPVIAAHGSVTGEATGPDGAFVSYTAPATSDAVDGPGSATCAPVSGSKFDLGDTTVTCNASDAAGNDAEATTFAVHVVDTTAPVIADHTNVTAEATSAAGALVSYTAPTTSDAVDGAGTATCAPASGSQFALGETAVTCNASDDAGNDADSTTFSVFVVDTTAPNIAPHGDVTAEATSAAGALVTYTAPATSDAVDGAGAATCSPASGSQFALGNTTVNCSATDDAGNTATPTSFVVNVVDTTVPVIAAHADVIAEATSASGALVNYTAPATSDAVDGAGTATCSPASGSQFALGETTITCNASDVAGNAATSTTFKIKVLDTTGPAVTVPANIITGPTSAFGANVSYSAATAYDLVDGAVSPVTCTPASGSLFGFGANTVTCSATDSRGNTGSNTFTVTVGNFSFLGFFQPIDNVPVVNTVRNGSTVPVKFKLQGQGGMEITSTSAVFSTMTVRVSCNNFANQLEAPVETLVSGQTSLRYDLTAMQFVYNWKTPNQANTCWRLDVNFTDGTTKSADFKLK
jgi:large repetitive protein